MPGSEAADAADTDGAERVLESVLEKAQRV